MDLDLARTLAREVLAPLSAAIAIKVFRSWRTESRLAKVEGEATLRRLADLQDSHRAELEKLSVKPIFENGERETIRQALKIFASASEDYRSRLGELESACEKGERDHRNYEDRFCEIEEKIRRIRGGRQAT